MSLSEYWLWRFTSARDLQYSIAIKYRIFYIVQFMFSCSSELRIYDISYKLFIYRSVDTYITYPSFKW